MQNNQQIKPAVPPKHEEPNQDNRKAIDTPEEVPESNDENIDQDFPGFPNNPSKPEKIKKDTANHWEDVENVARPFSTQLNEEANDARVSEQELDRYIN